MGRSCTDRFYWGKMPWARNVYLPCPEPHNRAGELSLIRADEGSPKNSGHCRVGHWRIPFSLQLSLQNRSSIPACTSVLIMLSFNQHAFNFQVPVTLPAFQMLLSHGKILSNENSDSTAFTPFTWIAGLQQGLLASYNILALRESFSTLSHCGLRKRKPLLLSDQAKYSQQSKPVTEWAAQTSDFATTQGLSRGIWQRAWPEWEWDSQAFVKLSPKPYRIFRLVPLFPPPLIWGIIHCSFKRSL